MGHKCLMNWKLSGRKRSWPNFKVLSRYSREGTEETIKYLSEDSQSPDQDMNLGLPEYNKKSHINCHGCEPGPSR
jgi:hypothetical protein